MKNSKTLKNVIEVLTAFIYFCGFMTVAAPVSYTHLTLPTICSV